MSRVTAPSECATCGTLKGPFSRWRGEGEPECAACRRFRERHGYGRPDWLIAKDGRRHIARVDNRAGLDRIRRDILSRLADPERVTGS